ncbi:major facilitator superfamily transporter [Ceratobasidium sp. AG-Ba]|nr:major facilitator superfamily transporter [Ceratobasidium sp. AG-Ba]
MDNDEHERHGLLSEEPDDQQQETPVRDEVAKSTGKAIPYKQAGILVFANAMVITAFQVIYPFINQMMVELGIAKGIDSAGYYSGVFESALSLAGFVTTIPCSYASDMFGRKPVLVISLLGTMVSMFFFGICTSYLGLLTSRCIGGAFGPNWTWAASFTMLGEITDPASQATVYSGINIGYSIGIMISPSIGGFLVHPSDHFAMFQGEYWKSNPYALPCFTGVFLCAITVLVVLIWTEETLPSKRGWARKHRRQRSSTAMRASIYSTHSIGGIEGPLAVIDTISTGRGRHAREATDDSEYGPASNIMITAFALAFLAGALFSIYPLWAFTPIDKGGLGVPESAIGLQLSIRGLLHVLTLFLYAPAEKRWVSGLGFPLINLWVRARGSADGFVFQVLLWVWLTIWSLAGFGWAGNPQMVNRVAPSEAALARTVGVSNVCIQLGATIGPVFATVLFQWSISLKFLGGNLVWVVLFVASSISAWHALLLREPLTDWRIQSEAPLSLSQVRDSGRGWE